MILGKKDIILEMYTEADKILMSQVSTSKINGRFELACGIIDERGVKINIMRTKDAIPVEG